MSAAPHDFTISEDGRTLTVRVHGVITRTIIATRRPEQEPFTAADAAKIAAHDFSEDVEDGQKSYARRLGRNLIFHIHTGPPTWWLPRAEVTKRNVMVGWLRGCVALSWRDKPSGGAA